MDEINDPEKTRNTGLAASVMDYLPVNISPKGKKQGDYFSTVVGPYDYWAIEYAYKPLSGGTEGEVAELAKIASRGTEPALQYATDEDAGIFDPDPLVNRFDLGKDPIEFARRRVELINQILPGLVDQIVEPGEGYQRARRAFDVLLNEHARAMTFAARFIGGALRPSRPQGRSQRPAAAGGRRAARSNARRSISSNSRSSAPRPISSPPSSTITSLQPSGTTGEWKAPTRPDFPVHETVLHAQEMVLVQLLSSTTLGAAWSIRK